MQKKSHNVRASAALSLAPVLQRKASLDVSTDTNVEDKDRALYRELCFGVCRHYFLLNAVVNQLVSKPLKSKDADVHALLLIGIYQLAFLRTPDHAAINETVNASKQLKKFWATKMVNGVLRSFLRDKENLLSAKTPETKTNHPTWLIKAIENAWPDKSDDIFQQNNQHAPMTLRVNQRKIGRDEKSQQLLNAEFPHALCEHSDHGITLEKPADVNSLPGFCDGELSVQDEAAQLSATLLDLKEGLHVLDACCAPGGKTCHIAESEPNLASLTAIELESARLERVKENLARLHLHANLIQADARDVDAWWNGQRFDRILLDAPCSATGVIRRHPDIKLLRRESDIAELSKLQAEILKKLWPTLSPGGLLVYATCSLLPQENEKVVQAFVNQQADAIHYPVNAAWGEARPVGRQLFPQANGHDGFYYAVIKKATN